MACFPAVGGVAAIAPNYAPFREVLHLFCRMNFCSSTQGCNNESLQVRKEKQAAFLEAFTKVKL